MSATELLYQLLYTLLYPGAYLLALFFVLPPLALLAGQSPVALSTALRDPAVLAAVGWTLAAAAAAVAGSSVLGVPLAYLLSSEPPPVRRLARLVLRGLQALPQPVVGVALVLFLDRWRVLAALVGGGPGRSFAALTAAMTFVAAPPLVASMFDAFTGPSGRLVMVARSLGAGSWDAFACGALPAVGGELRRAVAAAWSRAAGELGVLLLVAATPVSGAIAVWRAWSAGRTGESAALALLLLIAVALPLALANLLRGYLDGRAGRPATRKDTAGATPAGGFR